MSNTRNDKSMRTTGEEQPDALLRALRDLPVHAPASADPIARRTHAAARAAFVREFDADSQNLFTKLFGSAGSAVVPVALASVVGLYLFWAFAAAISLNQ